VEEVLSEVKKIHLVGICGSGMSGLALILKDKGFEVSGSDAKSNPTAKILEDNGVKVFIGHQSQQVASDVNLLGFSSAVSENNPEIQEAKRRGINILKRGKLLAGLSKNKKTIAVAGSHGKTTTTSLLSYILTCLGYQPTVFVGGLPLNYSKGAWLGGDYFVIETDESDGSFLEFDPEISLITNIDREHLDYYKTFDNLKKSFLKFALKTSRKVIGWGDDIYVSEIIGKVGGLSFGWNQNNLIRGTNFRVKGNSNSFDLEIEKEFVISVETPLLGRYNCLNTLAVLAFFYQLGEDLNKVNKILKDFKGTKRRFQVKAEIGEVTFIDDYAHHPSEIKAVLGAAKLLNPKRIVAIVQPHRFSRVKLLIDDFPEAFVDADCLVVTDIYAASEDPSGGINSKSFFEAIKRRFSGKIEYIPKARLAQEVPLSLEKGDLVLGLGAGDINILIQEIIDEFKRIRLKA
jgi:UDP-N-acetylmuramate--alanine ligase